MVKLCTLPASKVNEVASEHLSAGILGAIAERGCARVAISGGSAMAPLASLRQRLGDAWAKVKLCWVDERCVEFATPESSRGSAYRMGALDESHPCLLELPGWLDDETPEQACIRIQRILLSDFSGDLDVVLLGMGGDGHIASLFPGHSLLTSDAPELVAYIHDSPKPPRERITLTMSILSSARVSILVALGESKRNAINRVVAGDLDLPASRISNLCILTDLNLEHI